MLFFIRRKTVKFIFINMAPSKETTKILSTLYGNERIVLVLVPFFFTNGLQQHSNTNTKGVLQINLPTKISEIGRRT